jgi:hypothetical protein
MNAFSMEEAAIKIGKRARRIVNISGVTSTLVGTVIRADAVDDGHIVSVIWDPQSVFENSLRQPPYDHDRRRCLLLPRPPYPLTMTAR